MSKKPIIEDIKRIISEQKLNMHLENSVRFILDDDSENFIDGLDIRKFRKICNWVELRVEDPIPGPEHRLYKLSQEFIDYFLEDIGWYKLSRNIELTEKFIEENSHKLNWAMISQCQRLSEDFIERHASEVSWSKIGVGQIYLSEEFIWKHRDKLSMNNVRIFNQRVSYEFKEKLKNISEY